LFFLQMTLARKVVLVTGKLYKKIIFLSIFKKVCEMGVYESVLTFSQYITVFAVISQMTHLKIPDCHNFTLSKKISITGQNRIFFWNNFLQPFWRPSYIIIYEKTKQELELNELLQLDNIPKTNGEIKCKWEEFKIYFNFTSSVK
jgi:hypothetical protein